ncbi:MAG: hypothetical protein OEL66_05505 [Desulfobulbaceae bacterium]|nr:hypothetical protein [Desulfobulbaceae bacterium]
MNTTKMLLPLLLTIFLSSTGCSGVQQPAPSTPGASNGQQQDSQTTKQSKNKGQLEKLIDQVVAEAKTAMRSRSAKLNDIVVEATPMWSLNYQGEIHVRVYDAAGHIILDEYRK